VRETPCKYEFHLLADPYTINAFALPRGPIYTTYVLFSKLENEDQLAGVLGHKIGHVLGRHCAERIAESDYWQGLTTAGSVAADARSLFSDIGQNTLLTNGGGGGDELEIDELRVLFMLEAGYNPEELIGDGNIKSCCWTKSCAPNAEYTSRSQKS
jgi:predicted Zn-dependent protease